MAAYYNDNDPFVCQWLRNLIAAGHIAPGDVDERSILDVCADDLRGYIQCHFFAGIGGWSLALRLAAWPDERRVFTGSCPCQPFSIAGAQRGSDDERHLWPAFFRLISECRPPTIFGEQVAGAAGLAWLDHVCADLEGAGYAAAAADLPAACVGAPHIRQRLWWVAHRTEQGRSEQSQRNAGTNGRTAQESGRLQRSAELLNRERAAQRDDADRCGEDGILAHADGMRSARVSRQGEGRTAERGHLGDAERTRLQGGIETDVRGARGPTLRGQPWRDLEWIACRDGKYRPTQPGLFPLAHGVPNRVGTLRGAGNAIVPQVAAQWIGAVMECIP